MSSLLIFVGCLLGIVLIGFVVSKVTGSKAYFVETFPLEPDERILWEDLAADAYPIPTRRALVVTYRRARRAAVRVTNLRIIAGTKPLFGSNHMVLHVLYPSDRSLPKEASSIGGGLLTRGYQVLVFDRRSMSLHTAEEPSFLELRLDASLASSLNLDRYRVYSDLAGTFPLPE